MKWLGSEIPGSYCAHFLLLHLRLTLCYFFVCTEKDDFDPQTMCSKAPNWWSKYTAITLYNSE